MTKSLRLLVLLLLWPVLLFGAGPVQPGDLIGNRNVGFRVSGNPILFKYTSGDSTAGATFSRTSTAYRTNSVGQIVEARANLHLRSGELANAAWTFSNATAGSAVVAPDGTTSAIPIVENASNAFHRNAAAVTVTSGTVYTVSYYLKRENYDWVRVSAGAETTNLNGARCWVNLAAGTVGSVSTIGTGWSAGTASITPAANGYYRVTFSFTTGATTVYTLVISAAGDGSIVRADIGSGAGIGTFVTAWGAQLEPGSVVTNYMATTASPYYALRDNHYVGGVRTTLLEGSRTNLLLRSEDYSDAAWVKTNVTVTSANNPSPGSVANATLITEGAGGKSLHQSLTSTAGNQTFSIYLKRGSNDWVRLVIYDTATSANRVTGWVNLNTGAIGSMLNGGVATGAAIRMEPAANGFYRCILSGSPNPAVTALSAFIVSASADAVVTTVDNSTRYQWGGQFEAAAFASSYIPTTAATVTRAADSLSFPFTHPPQEMSVYVRRFAVGAGIQHTLMAGTAGAGSPLLRMGSSSGNAGNTIYWSDSGGSNVTSTPTGVAVTAGALVEETAQIFADGSVQGSASLDGAATVSGSRSAGSAPNSNALNPILVGATSSAGFHAFRDIIIVKGQRDMSYFRSRVAP